MGGGYEQYDKTLDGELPQEIESCKPDYTIYPEYDFAVSMTSRGCPRGCAFCHVVSKEGRKSRKVANVDMFYQGQKEIQVLDPNITACRDKRDLFDQYIQTGALIDFNQGLDIRLINSEDIADINKMKLKSLHFAWDNPKDNLLPKFQEFASGFDNKSFLKRCGVVFCLTNFNSTMEENLYRIYSLRDLGFNPYVMVYNKPNAPREIRDLQRWCNNKWIFRSCAKFEDYQR